MTRPHEERPRRWARIVDILEDGTLYTERLRLAGIRWPQDGVERASRLHELALLVHDQIVFFEVTGEGDMGTLEVEVWVGETRVNGAFGDGGVG